MNAARLRSSLLVILLVATAGRAGTLRTEVGLTITYDTIASYSGQAWYDYDYPFTPELGYRTWIQVCMLTLTENDVDVAITNIPPSGYGLPDVAYLQQPLTWNDGYGKCYRARIFAQEGLFGSSQGAGTAQACTPDPPPSVRYRLQVWTCLDGSCTLNNEDLHDAGNTVVVYTSGPSNYQFNGWSGDVSSTNGMTAEVYMDRDKSVSANWASPPNPGPEPPEIIYEDSDCPQYQNCHSPIVLNTGGGGYELSGKNDPVLFDIDANGKPIPIGWTAAGAPMAFLALDRNHNGRIDDGSELFGNHTPLPGGSTAANGFQALVPYDANGDGVIDARDPIWSSLLLWTDDNHDGISQAPELLPVSQSSVVAIGLDYHWSGRRDPSGNHFRYQSKVWMNHGGRQATPRPVYDVFFVTVPYVFVVPAP